MPKAPSSSTTPMAARPRFPATARAARRRSSSGTAVTPGSGARAHRRGHQDAAAARARRLAVRIRNEHGPPGDRAPNSFDCRSPPGRATLRSCGWATRNAPCRWRISISTGAPWARRSSRTRIFPTHQRLLFRARGRACIDVRFYERGAGETMSSGTGSTGAAAAAVARWYSRIPRPTC